MEEMWKAKTTPHNHVLLLSHHPQIPPSVKGRTGRNREGHSTYLLHELQQLGCGREQEQ